MKVLVFGTGAAAESLVKKSQDVYEIIGFIDNSSHKQGNLFYERMVYSPEQLPSLHYDAIIIASQWHREIRAQLMNQCHIAGEKIRLSPKAFASEGKRYRPFSDPDTLEYARKILIQMTRLLEDNHIPCFIDHGTLLGLVRDGDILPWDDDIDLSVDFSSRYRVFDLLIDNKEQFLDNGRMEGILEILYNSIDEEVAIWLTIQDAKGQRNTFNVGISFFQFVNGLALEAINWSPEHFYLESSFLETGLGRFRIPADVKEYLRLHYGNWQTPVKDIAFGEIDNFKTIESTVSRIVLDGKKTLSESLRQVHEGPILGKRLNCVLSMQKDGELFWVDGEQIISSSVILSQVMHLERLMICGPGALFHPLIERILKKIHELNLADRILLQLDTHMPISQGLLDVLKQVDATVVLQGRALSQSEMDLVGNFLKTEAIPFQIRLPKAENPWQEYKTDNELMLQTIRQLRCAYKKAWTLMGNTLAHCPRTLSEHVESEMIWPDGLVLEASSDRIKNDLLSCLRHRPCRECDRCPSNWQVWAPYHLHPKERNHESG